ELGKDTIDEAEVKEKLLNHFTMLFEAELKQKTEA
ncbi:MAG: lipoyl(octanoyl) transferase, partial [Saprospiraceae bacterium]|nr:lipoyl(octanoyl) transferase [Saprospiraceae bacterium]